MIMVCLSTAPPEKPAIPKYIRCLFDAEAEIVPVAYERGLLWTGLWWKGIWNVTDINGSSRFINKVRKMFEHWNNMFSINFNLLKLIPISQSAFDVHYLRKHTVKLYA